MYSLRYRNARGQDFGEVAHTSANLDAEYGGALGLDGGGGASGHKPSLRGPVRQTRRSGQRRK